MLIITVFLVVLVFHVFSSEVRLITFRTFHRSRFLAHCSFLNLKQYAYILHSCMHDNSECLSKLYLPINGAVKLKYDMLSYNNNLRER